MAQVINPAHRRNLDILHTLYYFLSVLAWKFYSSVLTTSDVFFVLLQLRLKVSS